MKVPLIWDISINSPGAVPDTALLDAVNAWEVKATQADMRAGP